MVKFMILLALGLASSEKLDRTYLPPPGFKFAGGSPGDLQVPLEPPKESFPTTLGQSERNDGLPTLGDSQVELGISRGIPDLGISTSGPDVPFTYFQNAYNVPTTTTSYAFSQTTTLPPGQIYDIITGPINPTSGLLSQNPTGIFQTTIRPYPQEHYNQNPDYVQYSPQSTRPEVSPGKNPLSGYVYQTPEEQAAANVRPTYTPGTQFESLNYQGQKPSLNVSLGNGIQTPNYVQSYNQQDSIQYPYSQQPINIYQQGILPSTVSPTSQQPTLNVAFGNTVQIPGYKQTYKQQDLAQNPGRPVNIGQQIIPSTVSPTNSPIQRTELGTFDQQKLGQYPQGQDSSNMGQQNFVPSTNLQPKSGITSQYDNNVNVQPFGPYDGTLQSKLQDTTKLLLGSNVQSNQPTYDQNIYESNEPGSIISQQNPSTNSPVRDSNTFKGVQNVYPTTTAAPGSALPNLSSFSGIPSSTTSIPSGASYPSRVYSAASTISPVISNQDTTSIRYKIRPERPQAEADRNAVILNYDNVRTPEGYSYSFDTSNGIHADESGVVIDGTKAQGSYSYIGDDGKLYSVIYTANENGFQPRGDHLPTSPPIPEAIQRVIEQAARDRAAGISDDGSYDETKYGHEKYQGKNHPQNQEITYNNGADIPDTTENQFSGIKKKQFRPHIGQVRPVSTTTEDYEFNDYGNRQEDYKNDETIKNANKKQFGDSNQPIDNGTPDSSEGTQGANAGSEKRPFKYPGSQHNGQGLTHMIGGFDKKDGHLDSPSRTDNDYNKDIFSSAFQKPMRKQSVMGRPDKNDQARPITSYKDKGIPQSSGSSTDNINVFDNRQTINVPSGFENKNNLPSFNPRTEFTTLQPINQETGYQYTRPDNKMTQEKNRFPSRVIETNTSYSTRKPSASASTTAKPFITPNIYQNDEEIEDETDEQTHSKKPIYPISEYGQSTTPDQIIGDDEISYTTVPAPRKSKPTSTRRPSYSAQTTASPNKYEDAYNNGSPRVNQKGTLRPGQGGIRYPSSTTFSTQTPGYASSTTPMPSTYTTTLTPQRTSSINRYQTTYKPTARPNFSDISPGFSSTMRSSVTPSEVVGSTPGTIFRPYYDVRDETVSKLPPGVKVDGFGRPIEQFNQYSDGTANPSITNDYPIANNQNTERNRPSSDVRNKRPGLNEGTNITFMPGVRFGQQTTLVPGLNTGRPIPGYNQSTGKVIGEDFSGPKRPQTFDPETGYHYK